MTWHPVIRSADLPPVGTVEGLTWEFKRDGYQQGKGHEIARDIAQFANLGGGSLIIGATERDEKLEAYVGIADPAAQETMIADAGFQNLAPRARFDLVRLATGTVTVLVVNVHPFPGVVGVRINDKWEFPVRQQRGKKPVGFEEVERMWTQDRRGRLLLEGIPEANRTGIRFDADLAKLGETGWELHSLGDYCADFICPDGATHVYIPYVFVIAVWKSSHHGEHTVSVDCALTAVGAENRVLVQRRRRS